MAVYKRYNDIWSCKIRGEHTRVPGYMYSAYYSVVGTTTPDLTPTARASLTHHCLKLRRQPNYASKFNVKTTNVWYNLSQIDSDFILRPPLLV
jgi:hypothetical protein